MILARFPAFRHRDFTIFWLANLVSRIGTQMREVALGWQIYMLTRSPLALGLVGACRVVPIAVFALGGGVVADAFDRRKVMLSTQAVLTVTSALMAFLTWRGLATVPILYVLIAVSAATNAFDAPARQTILTNLLPIEDLENGLSIGVAGVQLSMAVGPAIGGIVLAATSVQAVYTIDAVSFSAVLAALLVVRPRIKTEQAQKSKVSLGAVKSVFQFLFSRPEMIWLMAVDFIATFFAGSLQLLPVFASDVFKVGARGLGWLLAAPAVGSVTASAIMSSRAPVKRYGATVLGAAAVYGACTALFGVSTSFVLGLLLLAGAGAADSVSTVVRQVVRQTFTPDELRGRMTGVTMIFFIGGPQLGEVEAGVVAKLTSARISVVSGGLACIAASLAIAASVKRLRGMRAGDATPAS